MSQVYATEPQTSGSVVFETTAGPLSIHLWCRECPHTVRYFLQLCVDGFYDNLVFHRIVPNFLIQTGDAAFRQSKDGGDDNGKDNGKDNEKDTTPWRQPPSKEYREQHRAAQALDRRRYELNSRIRFNHRGQIAMALETTDDNNSNNDDDDDDDPSIAARLQPQFFITLDEASHLDGKHVCFGGITGPTIFNALRIGRTDIYHNDTLDSRSRNFQPRIVSEAPRILRTKILAVDLPPTLPAPAPTQDRALVPWTVDPAAAAAAAIEAAAGANRKRKKKHRKGVKNTNLLSFGEEMVDENENENKNDKGTGAAVAKKAKKIQSSHDVLASKSLSAKSSIPVSMPSGSSSAGNPVSSANEQPSVEATNEAHDQQQATETTTTTTPTAPTIDATPTPTPTPTIAKNRSEPSADDDDATTKLETSSNSQHPTFSSRADRTTSAAATHDKSDAPENDNTGAGHPVNQKDQKKKDKSEQKQKQKQKMSLVEARRARYANKNKNRTKAGSSKQQRENDTMARFRAFQQKLTTTTTKPTTTTGSTQRPTHDTSGGESGSGGGGSAAYHGQVLEMETDAGNGNGNDWMRTKFKCKKHMDQDAKTAGSGADGRGVDDYLVIEQRGSATDRLPGKRRRHRHG